MTRVLDYGNDSNYGASRGPMQAWRIYRRLLGYAFRYKYKLAVTVFFSVVVALSFTSLIVSVGASITILFEAEEKVDAQLAETAQAIDDFFADSAGVPYSFAPENAGGRFTSWAKDMRARPDRAVLILSITLIVLSLVGGLARFLQEYFAGTIGTNISVQLNRDMYSNLIRQSHDFFEVTTTGEVVARFTNDAFIVNKGLTNVLVKLFREPIKIAFALTLALRIDVVLTGVVLLVIPPVVLILRAVGRKVRKSARRSMQRLETTTTVVHETVKGISIVKSFRMENYGKGRVQEELTKLRKHLIRLVRADAAVGPSTEFLLIVGVAAFIILSERLIASGGIGIGELSTLFFALAWMMDPLRKLATVNNQIQTSVASAERVFEFIDAEPSVAEMPGAVELLPLERALRFEDVHFSYNDSTEVLKGITFEVNKGEMVALVGFSGAGKSTLIKLIPRFYDPTSGRVTIDGLDIREATLASLRDQISIVTQDTILFQDTVKGNIAFGQDRFSQERILQAARAAHAHDFIEALPQGYDTLLSEGGGTLSGGQRQRLAIARAVIKDPSILILDEATSSLDSESENAIQRALDEFVVGRTTVVIAHRLSTIQRADRIIVIDDGRVVEEGNHRTLMAKGGLYQRLYSVQFAPSEAPSTP